MTTWTTPCIRPLELWESALEQCECDHQTGKHRATWLISSTKKDSYGNEVEHRRRYVCRDEAMRLQNEQTTRTP